MLVVDDDPDILHLLGMLLSSEGCEAREASDGASALSLLDGVDVALVDQRMPEMTGTELIAAAKAAGATCRFLVVSSDIEIGSEARAAGADAFLPKPIHIPALLSAIGRLFAAP